MTLVLAATLACRGSEDTPSTVAQTQTAADSEVQKLEAAARRFAPVDLTADVASLPENERRALAKIVEAAKTFDTLFLRQVWEGNETMLLDLIQETSPLGRARLHYFLINKGPWSRLDHNEPFIPGAPAKPPQVPPPTAG